MSGKGGGSNGGKGSNGISGIPSASRRMVLSLKEIVNNCTEQEIYAMLKDCNMDPNETVNRLLAQGPPFFFVFVFCPLSLSLQLQSCSSHFFICTLFIFAYGSGLGLSECSSYAV